jgi:hypothetical protein
VPDLFDVCDNMADRGHKRPVWRPLVALLGAHVTRTNAAVWLTQPAIEQHVDRGKPLAVITLFGNLKQRAQAKLQVFSSFAPEIGNRFFRSATGISADPFLERHGSTPSLLPSLLLPLNLNITITRPKLHTERWRGD